jgi:hypothetical protein
MLKLLSIGAVNLVKYIPIPLEDANASSSEPLGSI